MQTGLTEQTLLALTDLLGRMLLALAILLEQARLLIMGSLG